MSATAKTRIQFKLPPKLKKQIEAAAAATGQTVSAFAVASLSRTAREVIGQAPPLRVSGRDGQKLLRIIDDGAAKPNVTLRRAASRHKKLIG